jgi:hypothetical protein
MINSVAGWRDVKLEAYDLGKIRRRHVRERDVLAFVALIVATCVMLTGTVTFALIV